MCINKNGLQKTKLCNSFSLWCVVVFGGRVFCAMQSVNKKSNLIRKISRRGSEKGGDKYLSQEI